MTKDQEKAIYNFHRMKAPSQIYVCPKCEAVLRPGDRQEDNDACDFDGDLILHNRCRVPVILYNRG